MMRVFLSASVPKVGRGNFYENANPFLIQCAVRELVITIIRDNKLVWGGHPSITPMIWAVCEDLKVSYAEQVTLYQSRFFEDDFPQENQHFGNVIHVPPVSNDRDASLEEMRRRMFTENVFDAAVFVGGMEGIFIEHSLFTKHHPRAKRIILSAPGGAAQQLAVSELNSAEDYVTNTVDFAELFETAFPPAAPLVTPRPRF